MMKNVANLKVNFSVYHLHIITRITIRRDKKKRKKIKIKVGSWLELGSYLTRARTRTWLVLQVNSIKRVVAKTNYPRPPARLLKINRYHLARLVSSNRDIFRTTKPKIYQISLIQNLPKYAGTAIMPRRVFLRGQLVLTISICNRNESS